MVFEMSITTSYPFSSASFLTTSPIFCVLFPRISLRSRSTSPCRSSLFRCRSRCLRAPCALRSASACGLSLPAFDCNCCWMVWISLFSFSSSCCRGLYFASRAAEAFLISSDSSTAFCRLITAIFVWADATPLREARARQSRNSLSPNLTGMQETPSRGLKFQVSTLGSGEPEPPLFQHRQNFVFAKNQVFVALYFDIRSRILAEQDAVAGLDVAGDAAAGIEQ